MLADAGQDHCHSKRSSRISDSGSVSNPVNVDQPVVFSPLQASDDLSDGLLPDEVSASMSNVQLEAYYYEYGTAERAYFLQRMRNNRQ